MTDTVTIPADIAHAFTDAWCSKVPGDIAVSLRCKEIDALADLLRTLGDEQAADEWIDTHAEGDEPNDTHFRGTVPAEAALVADGMRWSPTDADAQS
ncbi:hypothetical protein ACFY5F_29795 [Streptomyces sp. NPDC013161]|uniref:hypothetical protein n=1 Tax=Streptomyces sp. NPDC013161 TaxID=3364862 RepID=UPI003693C563